VLSMNLTHSFDGSGGGKSSLSPPLGHAAALEINYAVPPFPLVYLLLDM
jgi:hypothetical protein